MNDDRLCLVNFFKTNESYRNLRFYELVMIDDEENFTAAAYEVEIMQLWDQLPDHAKTISLIQRIKQIASIECQEVVSKLVLYGKQDIAA